MKSSLATMTITLTVIASALGGALGWVHHATEAPIAQAQERAKTEALESVLPDSDSALVIGSAVEITVAGDSRPVTLYPLANAAGALQAVAVETWTMDGFSGEITIMAGFSAADGALTGYRILQSAETPGLGSKAQEWFTSIIGSRKPLSVSKDGGDVDAITAATITSRAFLDAINRGRQAFDQYLSKK